MRATNSLRLMRPAGRGGLTFDQIVAMPWARVTNVAYGSWKYRGGPRLAPLYAGDWEIGRRYPFMSGSEWNFDSVHLGQIRAALPHVRTVGGTVGGLTSPATLALNPRYGVKTLYGSNCIPPQDVFGYCDYGSAEDRDRQLNATQPPLTEGQRGTRFWAGYGRTVHYDDFSTLATLWFYGGCFGSEIEASFQIPGYGALLRTQYPSDAAYIAACRSQTRANHPPNDEDWRHHLLRYCRQHARERVRPLHRELGIESSYNGFAAIPSSWVGLCNLAIGAESFDRTIVELNAADTEPIAQYQDAHDLDNATRLLTYFARIQFACQTVRAFGAAAVLAPYPYLRWVPPRSDGQRFSTFAVAPPTFDELPPISTSYTEPVTVAANYRAVCAWILANGCMVALPIQVFDYITNFLGRWQGATRMQWTADPADFADLFSWVGAHRQALFDGFDCPVRVALAVPDLDERYSNSASNGVNSATSSWASPYEVDVGPGWDINRLKRYSRDIVAPLMTRGLSWMLALLGPGLDRSRNQADYPFADLDLVVRTEPSVTYSHAGTDIPTVGNVQDRTWLTGANLDPLRTVIVTGATDAARPVLSTLRAHPDGRVVVHVVNLNNCTYGVPPSYAAAQLNAPQAALQLRVRRDVLGPNARQPTWFAPGQSGGRPLRMVREDQWVVVGLPPVADTGAVLFAP